MDLESEDTSSNLDCILAALKEAGHEDGFHVQVFRVISSDYGTPQRRVRLYFVGVNRRELPHFKMKNVEKSLHMFKLKCQPPAT